MIIQTRENEPKSFEGRTMAGNTHLSSVTRGANPIPVEVKWLKLRNDELIKLAGS
jgi:hypothetical protein